MTDTCGKTGPHPWNTTRAGMAALPGQEDCVCKCCPCPCYTLDNTGVNSVFSGMNLTATSPLYDPAGKLGACAKFNGTPHFNHVDHDCFRIASAPATGSAGANGLRVWFWIKRNWVGGSAASPSIRIGAATCTTCANRIPPPPPDIARPEGVVTKGTASVGTGGLTFVGEWGIFYYDGGGISCGDSGPTLFLAVNNGAGTAIKTLVLNPGVWTFFHFTFLYSGSGAVTAITHLNGTVYTGGPLMAPSFAGSTTAPMRVGYNAHYTSGCHGKLGCGMSGYTCGGTQPTFLIDNLGFSHYTGDYSQKQMFLYGGGAGSACPEDGAMIYGNPGGIGPP